MDNKGSAEDCVPVDIGLPETISFGVSYVFQAGSVKCQKDQRLYLRPKESHSFSKFRDFKFEDPISTLKFACC